MRTNYFDLEFWQPILKDFYRRDLSDSTYVLCFERNSIIFSPGQHINIGLIGDDNRPYSIYSGLYDNYLEILVKKVNNGNISCKLKLMDRGDYVSIDQPQGSFTIEAEIKEQVSFWFIGTGTGISPFHSFVRSYPELNYRIIHGIRYEHEAYECEAYRDGKYMCCTTRNAKGDFYGRITEYLKSESLNEQTYYFLCGNYEMIDEVFDLLIARGIDKMQIKTEGYF